MNEQTMTLLEVNYDPRKP